MASGHLLKAILKMTSRIPYWPYVLSDLTGVQTAHKILNKSLVLDKSVPIALYPAISIGAAAIFIIALVATLLIFHKSTAMKKLDTTVKVFLFLGVFAYWSIFALTIFKWRF